MTDEQLLSPETGENELSLEDPPPTVTFPIYWSKESETGTQNIY